MKKLSILVLFSCRIVWGASAADFVGLPSIDYTIKLDIRYATADNFTKKVIYPEARCVLRRPVALALSRVQSTLKLQGFGLKVYDCYRPLSVQKKFWEIMPDERYVANPAKGSKHNRGAAVDLTLIDSTGKEVAMPTPYDTFSEAAHRDYKKSSKVAQKNMKLLEKVMVAEGFLPLPEEWWHFDYKGWEEYEISDVPLSDFK